MCIQRFASLLKIKFVAILTIGPYNQVALHQQRKPVLIILRKRVIMYQRNTATTFHTRLRKWYATTAMRAVTWLKIAMHLMMQAMEVEVNHITNKFESSNTDPVDETTPPTDGTVDGTMASP